MTKHLRTCHRLPHWLILKHDSAFEDLFHWALPSSESSLRFGHKFLGLSFRSD
ncbi:hypothetical protein DPMN_033936 [Dreissena polymorpha]|uniref:Uncharacterized protein n=1 Tax=Dreissena polymorpha TaxID=45954 RepID=A0A9D4M988_DREPO|nr:hypothetical protein DPMN_033936 [Dreissena polymorpha]